MNFLKYPALRGFRMLQRPTSGNGGSVASPSEMGEKSFRWRLRFPITVLLLLGAPVVAQCEEAARCIEAMSSRQAAVHSFRFIWIETVHTYRSPYAEDARRAVANAGTDEERAFAKLEALFAPSEDSSYRQQVELCVSRGRMRFGIKRITPRDDPQVAEGQVLENVRVFDGGESTIYSKAASGATATLLDRNTVMAPATEYIGARPIILAYRGADWVNLRVSAEMLALSNETVGMIGNHRLVVLGSTIPGSTHEHRVTLWVDPERDGHVYREVKMFGDHISAQLDVSYLNDPEHGLVPSQWTRVSHWPEGGLKTSLESTVVEYSINEEIADTAFKVQIPSGTHVNDRRSGENLTYFVNDDGEWIPFNYAALAQPTTNSRRRILLLNGIFVVLLAAVFAPRFIRRRMSR